MTYFEIAYASTSALRRRITILNRAAKGAVEYPNGMSGFALEDIAYEKATVAAELKRRKH